MKFDSYIINSPDFPKKKDFLNFGVWCEWNELEEVAYLKSICESKAEYHTVITVPYEQGLETYYPIINENNLPSRVYLFLLINIKVEGLAQFDGYASLVDDEVTSVTVWKNNKIKKDITFLNRKLLVADEENPKNIALITKATGIDIFSSINYNSDFVLSNGVQVCGNLELK